MSHRPNKLKVSFTISYTDYEGVKRKFKECGKLFITSTTNWMKRGIIDNLKITRNKST